MKVQWEYREIDLGELLGEKIDDALNEAGEEGWELVSITVNDIAYLKRPAPTSPSATPPPVEN